MSTTVLATSLQSVLQGPTAAAVVAVGVAVLLGTIWLLRGTVLTDDEVGEPISDGGTTGFADATPEQQAAENATERSADSARSDEELEHRLDELETEVDSLSSTVKTVRNENEQISESVKDIEENTGRLLNLYQMATRGVNPFSGETEPEPSAAVAHESTEEFDKDEEIEEIETDVADDSAANLFDSEGTEIRDEHCVDSVEEVVDSGAEPDDAFQRSKQAEQAEPETPETEEVEEVDDDEFETGFESSSAEATESEEPEAETFGTEEMIDAEGESAAPAASDGGQLIESLESDTESAATSTESPQTTDSATAATERAAPTTDRPDPAEPETTDEQPSAVQPATDASAAAGGNLSEGKPYVDSLPEGFSTEVMTVEWLEYLVEEVGIHGTLRALEYYETIGWLTEDAVAELDEYLGAFEEASQEDLSVEHHLRSLDYVEELKHASEE